MINEKLNYYNILVIGGCHHNTLGVLRSIGYKGLKSDLLVVSKEKHPYIKYSKYIRKCYQVDNWSDIVPFLQSGYKKDTTTIVISCADPATYYLDQHSDILRDKYYLPVASSQGKAAMFMDKDEMRRIAIKVGLKTPKEYDFQEVHSNAIDYPIIIKPLISVEGCKSDIVVLDNNNEFIQYKEKHKTNRCLVQKYINKSLEFQLIGCSLNSGENVIIPGASIIQRQPRNTNTGSLIYVPFDDFKENGLLEKCTRFIQEIGYSGLFSMEFLRDINDDDYFMEINMRNDGNSICVTAAGINLPYIWCCSCAGVSFEDELNKPIRTVRVMPEFSDYQISKKYYGMSFFQWLKEVKHTDCFMEFSSKDALPFVVGLSQLLVSIIKRRLSL